MDDEALKDWLNAVLDAQKELSEEPIFASLEEEDECWGFFSEWRHMIIEACWASFVNE